MDQFIAKCLSNKILEDLEHSSSFSLEGFDDGSDDERGCFGKFLIQKDGNTSYWVLVVDHRRSDNYYVVLWSEESEENKSRIILELHHMVCEGNRLNLLWKYKPTKHDGRNEERKQKFLESNDSLDIAVPLPSSIVSTDDFLNNLFSLARTRLLADILDENA